jgi:hypothetical protein
VESESEAYCGDLDSSVFLSEKWHEKKITRNEQRRKEKK